MKRSLLFGLLALAVSLGATSSLSAAPRQRTHGLFARPAPRTVYTPNDIRALNAYPKYYGGFHSNNLSNIGIPNGDIGTRGNGITALPW